MITGDLKGILSIKIKSRHDSYSDQFNRIFIVKILLICSLVMGINWFKDGVNCIVPGSSELSSSFVSSACWIQGLYVFEELKYDFDRVAYYGIPKIMNHDGVGPQGYGCSTKSQFGVINKACKPLTKTFFLQYQWMPFYIGALAICFYLPYILHIYGNNDLINLKRSLKSGEADASRIIRAYFNHHMNPVRSLRLRIVFSYLVKFLYLIANIVAFCSTDKVLHGKFVAYGSEWIQWSRLENSIAFDYMGERSSPKPGHKILPPFGYCELYESARDARVTRVNKHTFLCELTQNILYQYSLVIIWFTLVFGMVVSCVGIIMLFLDHMITLTCVIRRGTVAKKMYKVLTIRECEYLEFIRRRNIPLYADVISKLKAERFGVMGNGNQAPCDTPPPGFDEATSTYL